MKSVRVRQYRAHRRVSEIDGVEVHKSPVTRDVIEGVPERAVLIERAELEAYEGRLESSPGNVGLEGQHTFIVREDGRVRGILIGFFDPHGANDDPDLDDVWRKVLYTHAYIDAMEVYDRRKGVGRRLVKAFETWAKGQGASGIAGCPISLPAEAFDTSVGLEPHPLDIKLWVKEL